MTSARHPVPTLRARPLVDRARDALLTAIREERFPDGRLPPEAALADQLGVSRGTLRAALQSLEADGIVSRRRRHGTYVNAHVLRSSMQLNRLVSFVSLVEQSGYVASVDPRRQQTGPASPDEAVALDIAPDTEVLTVFRLLRADNAPVITITDVICADRLTVAPSRLRAASTTFEFLEANTDTTADYATTEIIPLVATATTPAELEMAPGTPYIQLREVVFNAEHERIALSVVCVVDRLVRLSLLRRGH
ncbi:GntR family transcriptional regulator [Conexibacter sp. DBS9H8]|uniref:GntR family transcriptional regulator n=1 Tax=Conexibacter sp. DBS9H8 TaxID=2937801 RepID=UPI00200C5356|nr:GntR family transcriptional regulator [Conexibacter sp. DBS9H8]